MYSDDIVSLLFDHRRPGEEWVVPEFSKIGFECMEMYSGDIASLLFDHRSPRWRVGSASTFENWLLNA